MTTNTKTIIQETTTAENVTADPIINTAVVTATDGSNGNPPPKIDAFDKYEEIASKHLLKVFEVAGRASEQLSRFREIKELRAELKEIRQIDKGIELAKQALEHIEEITAELIHLDELLDPIIDTAKFLENGFRQAIERKEQEQAH